MKIALLLVMVFGVAQAVFAESTVETFPQFKPNGLLQAWTVSDSSPSANPQMNFRLRRAEFKLSGAIVEKTRYFVAVDAAKAVNSGSDSKILQDLGVAFKFAPGFEIVAGQFKTLTDAEGLASSAELLFPERSFVGRTYGDRREPGLMVTYEAKSWKAGIMASNGQGTNADAINNTKDITVRTDFTVNNQLKLGAFVLLGDLAYDRKGRWGANARLMPTSSSTIGVEYAMGKDGNVSNLGLVVDAGYLVTSDLQPVIRYEIYQPNTGRSELCEQISLGVNYLFSKHNAKIQAAYSYLSNFAGNNGSPRVLLGSYGNLFTLSMQMAI